MADIWINILGDASKLTGALGQAGGQVEKFAEKIGKIGRTMTIVGGAVTAAFGAIVLKTTQLGDTYDKMAKRTNVSVEALSALGYAAKISGADLDTVEKSLRYLARGMSDAAQGVGESLEAFEYLNISVVDTEGNLRDTVDVLKEAATKLAAMTDETKQIALATEIFGARYGTQLLPLLKEGGKGIEALMEKAKKLGLVWDTETAEAAANLNDRMTDVKESIAALGKKIGEILIPLAIKLAEKAVELIKRIADWAEAHKPLVEMIIKVGATLGVLAAVGGPILIAVSAFMKMKGAIIAIGTALKLVGSLALTNPIGMAIAAVGALYLAWTTNFGGIRDFTIAVVEKVKEALGWLWDKVKWVLEKLGLYKEKIEEINPVASELAIATEEAGEKAGIAAKDIGNLADSMGELGTKTDEAKEALDEFGNKIETFDEWVERLAEESEKANEKMAKAAEDAYKKYTDAMKPVEDRLYELSHTEEEVAARNLLTKKQQLEGSVKAAELSAEKEKEELTKIREWYDKEIDLIVQKLEEQKKALIDTATKTEESANIQKSAIREITSEYDELIAKIHGVGKAIEEAAKKAASEAFLAGVPMIKETGYVPSYIPKFQVGTPSVPRTGLALVHQGEEINPPGQRSYDQRKREINININNPVVRNDNDITKIKQQVEGAFWEFVRQFGRSGYELPV